MERADRRGLIEALERERGNTTVISYVTSTRPDLDAQMAMDVVPIIYKHLEAIKTAPEDTKIDLFITSHGGEGVVPWRLVTLIREFCAELSVLVPYKAFSAATLVALGADQVVMHPMGMLGPTDPTVGNEFNPAHPLNAQQQIGISVEDVAAYISLVKDEVGIRHDDELVKAFLVLAEKVHPLALGNVHRSIMQSRMMGQKLLQSRAGEPELNEHEITEITNRLSSELFFHGHPINRREARDDIGLRFVQDATPAVASAMWDLLDAYRQRMALDEPFQPVQEVLAKQAVPLPAGPQPGPGAYIVGPPNVVDAMIDPIDVVFVESLSRCDVFQIDFDVTVTREWTGEYQAKWFPTQLGWREDADDGAGS